MYFHRKLMASIDATRRMKSLFRTMGYISSPPKGKTLHGTRAASTSLVILVCLFQAIVLSHGQDSSPDQTIKFSVVEEEPADTPVGNVSTAQVILDKVPEAERPEIQFSMRAKDVKHQNLFRIDRQSGAIKVAQAVNREDVCPRTDDCILHFDVFANKGDFFEKIPIVINVTDINDNSPMFHTSASSSETLSALEVRFPESSPQGSVRPLLTATDADMSQAFGSISYRLEPASSVFSLDVSQNPVGTQQINLRLLETLDRETTANYTLRLVATDGGDPPKTGVLTIHVLVEDFNDNKPVFTQNIYSTNFSETEGKGYEIVKIHARDSDVGKNGRVQYFLSSQQPGGNSESIVDKVVVDETSGSVSLRQSLSSGQYTLWVEARDMGDSVLFDQAEIQISVLDTDNNEPTIRLDAVPQAGDLPEGWVSESENVGQVVGYLTVEDPDSGNNGNVSCFSLESHFKLERLSQDGDYKLVLARQLDFEAAEQHTVEAVCKDQGSPSLNATARLVVKVADENDNKPEFTKNIYTQGIFENNVAGDTVVVVTATDRDSHDRGRVQYRLLQDAGSNFTISPFDGVIKTTIRFNREDKDVYEFTVLATDAGKPPLNSTAFVRIQIRDKNDVAPVFGRPQYKFHLYENREADSIVGNITVSDPDLGDGGKIKLSLVFDNSGGLYGPDNGDKHPFSISDDGKIFSRQVFDREEKSSYSFYVVATDQGQRQLSSSVEAIVEILDVNDHRPAFSFPSEHNFSALANIPIRGDQPVLRVDVTDLDAGKNSIISYSIVSSNASAGLSASGNSAGRLWPAGISAARIWGRSSSR
ncbi:hypothetical protein EGW08_003925 [Elysia chlorotica]|uniref:Cadherin domain-containing protein n=1 Tax=Elysia chlorotica TaxID=188477 RepID=A0A3S1BHA2_ELYCH|nr:hypothetical protein EGW08_003925 [Elysia chlorotica]